MIIESKEQYDLALLSIQKLDIVIGTCYSELSKTIDTETIIQFQDIIAKANQAKSVLITQTELFQNEFLSEADAYTEYIVKDGDCLQILSQMFFGTPFLWHYIYTYNNLTDLNLHSSQKLFIPTVDDRIESIFFASDILLADALNGDVDLNNIAKGAYGNT